MGIQDDHRCQRTGSGRSGKSTWRTGMGTRECCTRLRRTRLASILQEIEEGLNWSCRTVRKLDLLTIKQSKGGGAQDFLLILKENLPRSFWVRSRQAMQVHSLRSRAEVSGGNSKFPGR